MDRPTIWFIATTSFISTLGSIALSTGVVWIFVREYGDAPDWECGSCSHSVLFTGPSQP